MIHDDSHDVSMRPYRHLFPPIRCEQLLKSAHPSHACNCVGLTAWVGKSRIRKSSFDRLLHVYEEMIVTSKVAFTESGVDDNGFPQSFCRDLDRLNSSLVRAGNKRVHALSLQDLCDSSASFQPFLDSSLVSSAFKVKGDSACRTI